MANTMQALFDQAKNNSQPVGGLPDSDYTPRQVAKSLYISIKNMLDPLADIATSVVVSTPAHKKALQAFDVAALDVTTNREAAKAAGDIVLAGIKKILDTRIRIGAESTAVDSDTKKPRKKSR